MDILNLMARPDAGRLFSAPPRLKRGETGFSLQQDKFP